VLLADDYPPVLARSASALEGECQIVGTVSNGKSLLAEAVRLDPDAIVLDITMPQLDGLAAARALRLTHSRARLVFLTVHDDPDFARAAFEAGALGYVVKPRLASDLLPAVRAVLAGRRFLSPTVHLDNAV
jgi:DNA-binding NarL/FixJ family response regulator